MESIEKVADFLKLDHLLGMKEPHYPRILNSLQQIEREITTKRVLSIIATLEVALQTESYSFERTQRSDTEFLLAAFLLFHEPQVKRLATQASLAYIGRFAHVPVKAPAVAHRLSFGQISQALTLIDTLIFEGWSGRVALASLQNSKDSSSPKLPSSATSTLIRIFQFSAYSQRKRDLDLFIKNWYLTTLTDASEDWPFVPTLYATWECARPLLAGSTHFLYKMSKDVALRKDIDPQSLANFEAFLHALIKLDAPTKSVEGDTLERIMSWARARFYQRLAPQS